MPKKSEIKALRTLFGNLCPVFLTMPKVKTAKLVAKIVEEGLKIQNSEKSQFLLCSDLMSWTLKVRKSNLKRLIHFRLVTLCLKAGKYQRAVSGISDLKLIAVKLNEKILLLALHLLESRVYHQLKDLNRAKASIAALRSIASEVHFPMHMQADTDSQSGILYMEENEYKSALSYFREAFEYFSSVGDPRAGPCLKYMVLCKIMQRKTEEVPYIMDSITSINYGGPELDSVKMMARSLDKRSLDLLRSCLVKFKPQLVGDPLMFQHLGLLYDMLLSGIILKEVEPYSTVEISYIAQLTDHSPTVIETKLTHLIVETTLKGQIDQGEGCFEIIRDSGSYASLLEKSDSISNISAILASLSKFMH